MKTFRLKRDIWLAAPQDEVFPFARASNLERLTPPWMGFEILSPSQEMRTGLAIDYRFRLHGFPLRWRTEISVWEPPTRFVDRRLKGPYRLWVMNTCSKPWTEGPR